MRNSSEERVEAWRRIRTALRNVPPDDKELDAGSPEMTMGFILNTAGYLASKYEVDHDRVQQILERTVESDIQKYYLNAEPEDIRNHLWLCFYPSLPEALEYLPSEKSLKLFEKDDLGIIRDRDALVVYLRTPEAPLYGSSELAMLLGQFASYLSFQRKNLVCTGYPFYFFPRSSWLSTLLGPLYFVKRPHRCNIGYDKNGLGCRFFFWRKPISGADQSLRPNCGYNEATYIPEISLGDAHRLESLREKLFDLKLAILHELSRSITASRSSGLWDRCLRLLTECLIDDEPEFLLKIDHLYSGKDFRSNTVTDDCFYLDPGGLTSLLELIGHCEQELSIGVYSRLADALGHDMLEGLRSRSGPGLDYFRACSIIPREKLDKALGDFLDKESEAEAFWQQYVAKVNNALNNEFFEEVVIKQKVRRKLVHQFRPHVDKFFEYTNLHLESMGELPPVNYGSISIGNGFQRNTFRQSGDYWKIVYDGKEVLLQNCKGVRYLAFLIRNPDKPFLALHLVMHDSGKLPEPDKLYSSMSAAQLSEEGLDTIGFSECDLESARTSVSHAIKKILKKLKKNHPACYEHFRSAINLGRQISYRQNSLTSWHLEK